MSDDISAKKELYRRDYDGFRKYLNRVYFERMSDKMMNQVFKAFWKFAFIKIDGEIFEKNRVMNRMALTAMVDDRGETITRYIRENKAYFTIAQDNACLLQSTILLAKKPQIYMYLDDPVKHQLVSYDEKGVSLIKWFVVGDLSKHIEKLKKSAIKFEDGPLRMLKTICEEQGQGPLFRKLIIAYYANSSSFSCAKTRFDKYVCQYMDEFNSEDFVELIEAINDNPQIYNYGWQDERNTLIVAAAKKVLPPDFDFDKYEHFEYAKKEPLQEQDDSITADETDKDPPF